MPDYSRREFLAQFNRQTAPKATPMPPRRFGQGQDSIWKHLTWKQWFSLAMLAGGTGWWLLKGRGEKIQERGTTGKMATLREQVDAYSSQWGDGGYQLGKVLLTECKSDFLSRREAGKRSNLLSLTVQKRLEHILFQGPTGVGKTTSVIVPQLISDAVSGIWNDYVVDRKSPELYSQTAMSWKKKNALPVMFDPWFPEFSWGFEPLWGASEKSLESMVQVLVYVSPDPNDTTTYYRLQEQALLRVLFTAAQKWGRCQGVGGFNCACQHEKEEHRKGGEGERCQCKCRRHFCTLPAIAELLEYGFTRVKAAIDEADPDLNTYKLADLWTMLPDKQAATCQSLANKLVLFRDPYVAAAFSRSDFTMSDIVPDVEQGRKGQRKILFLGAAQSEKAQARTLISFMTQMLIDRIFERARVMREQNATWKDVTLVSLFLDEIGTYQIQDLEDFQATARSSGAAITAGLQMEVQLGKYYGRDNIEPMTTNYGTHLYLTNCHPKIAEKLSIACGERLVYDRTTGISKEAGTGLLANSRKLTNNTRMVPEPVKSVDYIINLPKDRAIVTSTGVRPAEIELYPFYQDATMAALVKESEAWRLKATNVIRLADREGRKRPGFAQPKLVYRRAEWEMLPAVQAAIEATMTGKKVSGGQEKLFSDLAQKLKLNDRQMDEICKRQVGKSRERLNTAEAHKVIGYMQELVKNYLKEGAGHGK